jgi:hypothetical protein
LFQSLANAQIQLEWSTRVEREISFGFLQSSYAKIVAESLHLKNQMEREVQHIIQNSLFGGSRC